MRRCLLEAWPGARCEMVAGHPGRCTAPSKFNQPAYLFDGEVPSHSDPFKRYRVVIAADGQGSCTCLGYQYNRTCSHINVVKRVLEDERDQNVD